MSTSAADPRVRPVLEEYEARTGEVPNLFRALARDPETLEALLPLLRRIYGLSGLKPDIKALVMLHVSRANECTYCGRDSVPTLLRLGYAPRDLEAIGEALPTEEQFGDLERAVLRTTPCESIWMNRRSWS